MKDIIGKIQIISGKCSPDVILFLIPALGKLLKLRNDQVIAACTVTKWPHIVIHFFSSVQTQDHIVHLFIHKLLNLVIQKYSIRCNREPEMFIVQLLLLSSVCHQIFDHLPVHQRLTTKEIHFQIASASRIGNQKIQSLFSHFITHERSSSMIFSFFRKAVFACQITIMGDMKTKCFHNRLSLLYFSYIGFIGILNEKPSFFSKLNYIRQRIFQILCRVFVSQRTAQIFENRRFLQGICRMVLILSIQSFNHIVTQIIYNMYCPAVYIQHDIISIITVLMNHFHVPLSFQFFLIQ